MAQSGARDAARACAARANSPSEPARPGSDIRAGTLQAGRTPTTRTRCHSRGNISTDRRCAGPRATVTSKAVLILGRFLDGEKAVLDALRDALREHNLTPIMFDFEPPASRDTTETIKLLTALARFVVVDLTNPRSVPHELASVIPEMRVPVVTLIREGEEPYAMFDDLVKYPWVIAPIGYRDTADLIARVEVEVIRAAEAHLAAGPS